MHASIHIKQIIPPTDMYVHKFQFWDWQYGNIFFR